MKKAHYTFDYQGFRKITDAGEWLGCTNVAKEHLTKKDFEVTRLVLTAEISLRPWAMVTCEILRNSRRIAILQIHRTADGHLETMLIRSRDYCRIRKYQEVA